MQYYKNRRTILLLLLVLASCSLTKQNESNKNTESNSIVFVVLCIHKDSNNTKHIVELVSKTQSIGKIKNQNKNTFHSGNYLTIYIYNDKNLIDTMTIQHPLYKHIEYLDENNTFAVEDTLVDKTEFFFRIQTQGNSNTIRVFETLKNKPREELITIKL